MYALQFTNRFKKDLVRCNKRKLDLSKLETAVDILKQTGHLPPAYKPHKLKGEFAGLWECHIEPDWLMIWDQYNQQLTLIFMATGTHSDLF